MHGKETFKKSIQRNSHHIESNRQSNSVKYLEIGAWRFQENDKGDLVVMNLDTQETVILLLK